MKDMTIEIILGIFLLICTVTDIKKREVKPAVLAIFGLTAAVLYLILRPVGLFEEIMGVLIGLFFVALYYISEEKIGLGDGLVMTVTGIFLGGRGNASLIMMAAFMSAIVSIVFLIIKKAGRKTKFPFVPFIFVSYVFQMTMRIL